MNTTVQTAIAAAIAELEVTSNTPVAPFYYGSDISCDFDVDPNWNEVQDSALIIAQHCVRAIDTPTGLPDEPEWGISVTEFCNRPTTVQELRGIESSVSSEFRRDDRIENVLVSVSQSTDYTRMTIEARITPVDPMTDDFTLILSASDSGVLIEEMSR